MTNRTQDNKPMDSEWFRRMAEFESTCESISVGGLAHDLGMLKSLTESQSLKQTALGKLIELARRSAGLGIEDLAKRADIEPVDIIDIERGGVAPVEPRTVYRLCEVLQLPQAGVMELAGLTLRHASSLGQAVVRFAAHAKGIEKLTRDERRALDEFVRDLAKASE